MIFILVYFTLPVTMCTLDQIFCDPKSGYVIVLIIILVNLVAEICYEISQKRIFLNIIHVFLLSFEESVLLCVSMIYATIFSSFKTLFLSLCSRT